MKYSLFFMVAFFFIHSINAQSFFSPKAYPANSFRNPLSTPFAFVGNFGETRPNHFHSGMDMRTGGKENQPVYAIGDGYISRVKIEAGGFGNAIYITHANGYTSVYAHLNKFFPALESFIRKKQYQNRDWKIDIAFFPDQFWVRKGSFIAWSGNTGSSQGPHLHFEIRNGKTESPLNPLLFYNEIADDKKPLIRQLAIYDAAKSIYEQTPSLYAVQKGSVASDTISLSSDKVFVGIVADDFMPMGVGTLGIYEMRMFADNVPVIAWQLDNISYDLTRYVNALADYKTRKAKGVTIQLCRKLPNNLLPVFKTFDAGNGILDLSDGLAKNIRIEIYDTRNNMSSISFVVAGGTKPTLKACTEKMRAGKRNTFSNAYMSFAMNEDALYDHICFKNAVINTSNPYSYIYQVHDSDVPVHSYFDLTLHPKQAIPERLKSNVAIVKRNGALRTGGTSARLTNEGVVAAINEFGQYEIVIDQKAPAIVTKLKNGLNISKSKILYFVVKDETTSVKKCAVTVDGQWLRLAQKGSTYFYEVDEYFPQGTHQLQIIASDENDNASTQTFNLTR